MNQVKSVARAVYLALGASNGPVSSMPGSIMKADATWIDVMCDNHPLFPAVARIQGETDSFGCEYFHACRECMDRHHLARLIPEDGFCDWHKGQGKDIRPFRDMDEGMSGPVYRTCGSCRSKAMEAARAELEEMDRNDPYRDVWFDDSGSDPDNEEQVDDEPMPITLDGKDYFVERVATRLSLVDPKEFSEAVTQATLMALEAEARRHSFSNS